MRVYDLVGKRFGKLVVLRFSHLDDRGKQWECQCDCGNKRLSPTGSLINGRNSCCGCSRRRFSANLVRQPMRRHGKSSSRIYRIWRAMIQRCTNPKEKSYARYGAKGVSVCERWRNFVNFYEDMGDPPTDKHELDRKDGRGNYEPGNCRWANGSQQNANKSAIAGKNGSRFKGVHRRRNGRWQALIGARPVIRLGIFDTEKAAAMAYDAAARRLYGEFAHCNFPERELLSK